MISLLIEFRCLGVFRLWFSSCFRWKIEVELVISRVLFVLWVGVFLMMCGCLFLMLLIIILSRFFRVK